MSHTTPSDPIAAVSHPDPYTYYADLALRRPYYDERIDLWIIAAPENVREVLAHPHGRTVKPANAPTEFDTFARFVDDEWHAPLRSEAIRRIDAMQIEEPAIATDDLDAFIERYAVYAIVRDLAAHVKGDILLQTADATRALIGNALVALANAPGLDADTAVEYALRNDPPVHNTRRLFVEDARIGGVTIPRGATALIVLVGSTFGSGPHACPGDAVASRIAAMALRRLSAEGIAPRLPLGYLPRPNVRIPFFSKPAP